MSRFLSVSSFLQLGLVVSIWFAALAQAGHDLWAAVVLFILLSALAVVLIVHRAYLQKPLRIPYWPWALALLVGLAFTSHTSYDYATSRFEVWIWFFCFAGFYLFVNAYETPEELRHFFALGSMVLLPIAVLCVYEQWHDHPEGYAAIKIFFWTIRYGHWEIQGTLISSIVLSAFALYWGLYIYERPRRDLLTYALAAAFLITLCLARSWWALISLFAGCLYYYRARLLLLASHNRKIILAVFALSVALVALVAYAKFGGHQSEHYSGSNRLSWWATACRMILEHPWQGVGLGAFATAYPYFKLGSVHSTLYAHSFPLQLLAETGLVCTVLFFYGAFHIFFNLRRQPAPQLETHPSLLAIQATLVTLFTYALITIAMEYFLIKYLFLLFLASLLTTNRHTHQIRIKRLWAIPLVGGIVAAVPFWFSPFEASRLNLLAQASLNEGNYAQARTQFQKALALTPYHGDYILGLAQTYRHEYVATRSLDAHRLWRTHLLASYQSKKDIRVLRELQEAERVQ